MLDAGQTLSLIEKAKDNDGFAKEKLIEENSPLIKSVVKRFLNKGIEYDDLYQLGSLGFLKAINNFDASFNVKFSTYAVPMIAGEIKRYMRDTGVMKVSRSVKTLSFKINKFVDEYSTKYDKSPAVEEIAKALNVDVHDVVYAMESSKQILSLDVDVSDGDGKKQLLEEKVANEDSPDSYLDNMVLYKAIGTLSEREKKIIILRYFRDKTQKEVATVMGVSQVQISRLENKIIEKIRNNLT